MCKDFEGSTKLPNSRVLRVVNHVESRLCLCHNEIIAYYSKHKKAFKLKWWHKLLGISDLDSYFMYKFNGEYSNIKCLYLHLKHSITLEDIANRYSDVVDFNKGCFKPNLFDRKFAMEYSTLYTLVKSGNPIQVTPNQMKFILYIEEMNNG